MDVKIPVRSGICTGKDGTEDIHQLRVSRFLGKVRIDCFAKRPYGFVLREAGIGFDRIAARALAKALIAAAK